MGAAALVSVPSYGRNRRKRLTFARLHLRYISALQRERDAYLDVEHPQPEHTFGNHRR